MKRRRVAAALIALAIVAAVAPLPPGIVERWYSTGFYPVLQRGLTRASNLAPFALFDAMILGAVAALAVACYRWVRSAGWGRGLLRLAAALLLGGSIAYLAFLALWGLNYRRLPLLEKVVFDSRRLSRQAALQFGDSNAEVLNRLYGAAHQQAFSPSRLTAAFFQAQRELGTARVIVPGRPKPTLLGGYFHEVAISGMTDPFFLETLVAPDLLDVERPFVIAHEWAHLAGYADESEASFVAWLACRHGDAAAQYSAALSLIGYAPPGRPLSQVLDVGPRSDLFAIRERYRRNNAVLERVAREGYDKYLKANRVERGVESYDLVVQLILGTEYDAGGRPRLR